MFFSPIKKEVMIKGSCDKKKNKEKRPYSIARTSSKDHTFSNALSPYELRESKLKGTKILNASVTRGKYEKKLILVDAMVFNFSFVFDVVLNSF